MSSRNKDNYPPADYLVDKICNLKPFILETGVVVILGLVVTKELSSFG